MGLILLVRSNSRIREFDHEMKSKFTHLEKLIWGTPKNFMRFRKHQEYLNDKIPLLDFNLLLIKILSKFL